VSQAKRLALGRPDVHGLASVQARALTRAAEQASLYSFHLGMAVAGLLVAAGGVAGVVGIRNPHRKVLAVGCPGGQLVGASAELAHPVEGGQLEAQPTGTRA
jgi:hypothetical protein